MWSQRAIDRGRPVARHDAGVTKPDPSLKRPVYSVAETAGLLGLRPDRTRAWLNLPDATTVDQAA